MTGPGRNWGFFIKGFLTGRGPDAVGRIFLGGQGRPPSLSVVIKPIYKLFVSTFPHHASPVAGIGVFHSAGTNLHPPHDHCLVEGTDRFPHLSNPAPVHFQTPGDTAFFQAIVLMVFDCFTFGLFFHWPCPTPGSVEAKAWTTFFC